MRVLKNLFSWFKLVKLMRQGTMHLAWYKIVDGVMKFALEAQQNGRPMLTKIAVVDMSKEKIIGDFDMVHLWAGFGECNPIERGRQIKSQNEFLKDQLRLCRSRLDKEKDRDLISNISIALDTFE